MTSRFVPTTSITVLPGTDPPIDIGVVELEDGDDAIWIKVTSLPSGGCPWPWSYGLLTWISENGRELGTVKVNGVCEGEVFRLGVGLAPQFRTGRLSFTPRSYNLKWVELGHPWTLSFSYTTGSTAVQPVEGEQATIMVPGIPRGNALPDFQIEGEVARLLLNLFFRR